MKQLKLLFARLRAWFNRLSDITGTLYRFVRLAEFLLAVWVFFAGWW